MVGEIVECLSLLIVQRNLPRKSILLTGWSVGATWVMAFLVHAPKFQFAGIDLSSYIRGVTLYGAHQLSNDYTHRVLAD